MRKQYGIIFFLMQKKIIYCFRKVKSYPNLVLTLVLLPEDIDTCLSLQKTESFGLKIRRFPMTYAVFFSTKKCALYFKKVKSQPNLVLALVLLSEDIDTHLSLQITKSFGLKIRRFPMTYGVFFSTKKCVLYFKKKCNFVFVS